MKDAISKNVVIESREPMFDRTQKLHRVWAEKLPGTLIIMYAEKANGETTAQAQFSASQFTPGVAKALITLALDGRARCSIHYLAAADKAAA